MTLPFDDDFEARHADEIERLEDARLEGLIDEFVYGSTAAAERFRREIEERREATEDDPTPVDPRRRRRPRDDRRR